MRLRRFAVPIVLVAAIVLVGGVTAALVAAKDQGPPAAPPGVMAAVPDPTSEPEPLVMPEPDPKGDLRPQTDHPAEGADAVPEDLRDHVARLPQPQTERPAKGAVPEDLRDHADRPPQPQTERPAEGAGAEEGASQGTVYTWQDGDRTRRVVLQTRPAARETVADATENGVTKKEELDSITRKQSERDIGGQPVFRSESGGELMTLPGGIVLALDPEWDRDAVESFFSRNGIALERTSELDFLDNGFFVETEPGFPSLELANALASQEVVILSSPNWAREVESK